MPPLKLLSPCFLLVLLSFASAAPAQECATVPLVPYAEESPGYARVQAAARNRRWDDALQALRALRDAGTLPPFAAAYAEGRLLEAAGRPDEALSRYDEARRSPLSDAVLYRQGLIRLSRDDVQGARSAFAGISPASHDWLEARLALAGALVREGRPSLARVVLKDLLRDELSGRDLHRARLALVEVLRADRDDDAARDAALTAWFHAPDAALEARAAALLTDLGRRPTALDRVLRTMVRGDGKDLARLAKQARRDRKWAKALDPGLAAVAAGAAELAGRKDPSRAAALLTGGLADARDPLLRAHALHALGQALAASGDDESARRRFEELLDAEPRSPFAASAAVGAARSRMRLSDYDGAIALLARVTRDHPDSGLDARARWETALASLMARRPEAALANLDEAARTLDRGRGILFGLAERVRYFRGAVLQVLGREAEAASELRRVARGYPHSYYAVLAASRLVEAGLDLPAAGPRPGDDDGRWRGALPKGGLRPAPTARTVQACGAALGPVELWRLGYGDEALDELRSRARLGLLDEGGVQALATLLADGKSHRGALASREVLRGALPEGSEDLLAAAYPRPWADAVEDAARATGTDPALLWGVMRAESGFDPSARSTAGAVGLMQLIPSTGRLVASQILRDGGKRGGLWIPARNVLLGAAFLGELERHFRGHLPLALAGYNAGPGAARRFWRRLKEYPTDILVEAMPYPGTVAYVKKVIGYAAGYRATVGGDRGPLLVPSRVPDALGPFLKPDRVSDAGGEGPAAQWAAFALRP